MTSFTVILVIRKEVKLLQKGLFSFFISIIFSFLDHIKFRLKFLNATVVDRMTSSPSDKDVYVPIHNTCQYIILPGKREFVQWLS